MPFQIFSVPISSPEGATDELNRFWAGHRVLTVERRWVDQGSNSFWSFCVEDFVSRASGESRPANRSSNARIDYREILSPEDFAVFAKLRDVRKEIATAEAIPAYMVFTNEQLAQIVKTHAHTKGELSKISGLGEARLDKYAERLLTSMPQAWSNALETPQPASSAT